MTLTLRPYTPDDADAALDAWEAASRLAHPFLTEAFMVRERERLRAEWLPAGTSTVAEVDGRVVGFVSLAGDEVGGLFVHPAVHGQGFGRALMDHAVASIDGPVRLEVFEANAVGRRFYDAYGFTLDRADVNADTGLPVLWLSYTP